MMLINVLFNVLHIILLKIRVQRYIFFALHPEFRLTEPYISFIQLSVYLTRK